MKRQHPADGVELNVTAMLDMAFQLLAFFILTFRPAPDEPAFRLHMPRGDTQVVAPGPDLPGIADPVVPDVKPSGVNTLTISLHSTSGGLERISINGAPADSLDDLKEKMDSLFSNRANPIERVVVRSSDSLHFAEMLKVVGMCAEKRMPEKDKHLKLSLVAMQDAPTE